MTLASWSAFEPGLTAIFASVAGIDVAHCGHRDGAHRMKSRGEGARLDWSIVSTRGIGRDELREEYDPDLDVEGDEYAPPGGEVGDLGGFVTTSTGNRAIVIQVMIDVDKASVAGGARARIEALRDRLSLPSVRASLAALGLALAFAGPAIDVGRGAEDEGGRPPSLYAIELEFNAASGVSEQTTTIEVVEITSRIATDKEPFGPI